MSTVSNAAAEKLGVSSFVEANLESLYARLSEALLYARRSPGNEEMMFVSMSLPIVTGLIHFASTHAQLDDAIRWVKTQAARWGSRPEWVGALGSSSGAHQAMLAGMRPHDPRYAALPMVQMRHHQGRMGELIEPLRMIVANNPGLPLWRCGLGGSRPTSS